MHSIVGAWLFALIQHQLQALAVASPLEVTLSPALNSPDLFDDGLCFEAGSSGRIVPPLRLVVLVWFDGCRMPQMFEQLAWVLGSWLACITGFWKLADNIEKGASQQFK